MKTRGQQIRAFLLLALFPLFSWAQTYTAWWKEVETLQQKDLPKSVIGVLDKIYTQAETERNLPQMMKAWLMRAQYRGMIAPDSIPVDRKQLEDWAEKETEPLGKAVLYSLLGSRLAEQGREEDVDSALVYFRRSLAPKEVLKSASADDFVPMTQTGKLSERYLGDSMYDLLTREAIRALNGAWRWNRMEKVQEEIVRMYDDLLAFYGNVNREGFLITQLAKAEWQAQRGVAGERFRLSGEEYGSLLEKWSREFADLEVCAEVYLRRALLYEQEGDLRKAYQTAEKGWKRYPKAETVKALKGVMERIETPALQVEIPFVYPEEEAELRVTYKNLTALRMEVYRLNLTPLEVENNRQDEYKRWVKKFGKRTEVQRWQLKPTEDFRQTDTVIRWRMPDPGIYLLKTVPEGYAEKVDYTVLHVSPYQCVALTAEKNCDEVVAVDKRTGQPVPGAELVMYEEKNGTYIVKKTDKAEERGSVRIEVPEGRELLCNVRTPGNDFMAIGSLSLYRHTVASEKEWRRRTSLFTDRSLYRPGQTVRVSGVVYRQRGDSLQVAANETDEAVLVLHGKEWKKTAVRTDEWGTFAAELVLPQQVLPGEALVKAFGTSAYIKVEEYKRPTFEVTFTPVEKAYTWGDSLRVEGRALTFAGAPVRNAEVDFRMTRAMRWFWMPGGQGEEIQHGTVRTDAEGRFAVEVCLTRPESEMFRKGSYFYYAYTLKAEVTDGAGETQAGQMVLPVGSCSIGLQIEGLRETMVREKKEEMVFRVQNLNGMPVDTEVTFRVFERGEDGKKGKLVYEGKRKAQEAFSPAAVWNLPDGMYRMEASACDEAGREGKTEQDFVWCSLHTGRMPVVATEWFYRDEKGPWSEENAVDLYVGSSEDSVYLFVDVYTEEGRIESERMNLSNEVVKLSYPYRKEYGDGVIVNMAFMKKGVWHSRQERLVRPEPEKQLRMKWETFRDRLTPGTEEEWRMQIVDKDGKPVRANVMAVLYDASLDRLYGHSWGFGLYFNRAVPYVFTGTMWNGQRAGMYVPFAYHYAGSGLRLDEWGDYSRLWKPTFGDYEETVQITEDCVLARPAFSRNAVEVKYAAPKNAKLTDVVFEEEMVPVGGNGEATAEGPDAPIDMPLRTNFAETAFFYPQLRTDSAGVVSMVFTLPDALTTWKWMGFAHTKAMDYGLMTDTVVASKPFMVQPNLPRFVRAGDRAQVAVSLVNLSEEEVKGTVRLQLTDPMTDKVVFSAKKKFRTAKGETGQVYFDFEANGRHEVLVCKVVAEAGAHTDGEQRYLPVLTDKQWVTETVPLQLDGADTLVIKTEDLFNGQSETAADRRLTVEMTANPDWYVVQALPALGNPASEDAIAWASAYYAQSLAAHLVDLNPRIEEVWKAWEAAGTLDEHTQSPLEKNADLKGLLEEEMPWLAEAMKETEQRRQIVRLFDRNIREQELRTAVEKLKGLQREDGSWSWYRGMEGNLYVTTQIAELLSRLYALTGKLEQGVEPMYVRAMNYLKAEVEKEYEELRKMEKEGKGKAVPCTETVRWLYMQALCPDKVSLPEQKKVDWILDRVEEQKVYGIYEKAMHAIVMQACGRTRKAAELMQSVKEYTVYSKEMGRYFDTPKAAYSWSSYRIPTQTAALEAIHRLAPDERMEGEMKRWLLKQKQVQAWETPIATADAVYAFLCGGEHRMEEAGQMKATVGKTVWETPQDALGYVCRSWEGKETKVDRVIVEKTGKGIGWGAVYAQYTEQMDRLKADEGHGLYVDREYRKEGKPTDGQTVLKPGDKLTVRLTVRADRDMDFVRVKDERAACMEPVEQLSGYCRIGGTGCYRVSRDASTEFFIDRMRKGTYVLEYDVYIDRSGTYRAGMASVQSVYAPEFAAHTGTEKLAVTFCSD